MEHFFSSNSSERSDAHQSQIIWGDADVVHTQTIGGIYPPHPPRVSAPLLQSLFGYLHFLATFPIPWSQKVSCQIVFILRYIFEYTICKWTLDTAGLFFYFGFLASVVFFFFFCLP